jgi:hypothetical protein
MNRDITITSVAEFEAIINALEASYGRITNIIANEKKNAERINSTTVWTGAAGSVTYQKYALLNTNYDQIDYSLDLYIKFLKKTLEDYTKLIGELDKNTNAMSSDLDVNS